MCGISGLVLREGEKVDPEVLRRMSGTLTRRGPDADGYFVTRNLGLAHRRLKIIDLSAHANQPMFNEDHQVGVIFNGEIYNFRELTTELQALGHRFKSRSDTEVLVHGFEEWGLQLFRKLNGIFAFALLDLRGGQPCLYLVRDRFGVKPLFYSEKSGRLAFGSTLSPLLEVDWVDRSLNQTALFHYLQLSHVPNQNSLLTGIRQLGPGEYFLFKSGQGGVATYWHPLELANVAKEQHSEVQWAQEFGQVLSRVVQRQRVADVPLGCFLSGGIDSSLLALACTELGGSRLKTFSIGYAESAYDETPYAQEVADALGTEHYSLRVTGQDCLKMIPQLPDHFDFPFADPTLLASLLLSEFTRKQVTVALAGDGGDELFFGYPYQKLILQLSPLLRVPAPLRSTGAQVASVVSWLFSRLGPQRGRRKAQQLGKLLEILQFKSEAEFFQYFIGMIGPLREDRVAHLLAQPLDLAPPVFSGLIQSLAGLPMDEKITQVFLQTFLTDTVLAKADRTSMAFGLEVRVPFLDHEMAEFSAKLPREMKLGKDSKALLRFYLRDRLPPRVSARKKQGFSIPMAEWLRGPLQPLLASYLGAERLKKEGLFAPKPIQNLVRQHLSGHANHAHLLWSLLCFQLWKERYLP